MSGDHFWFLVSLDTYHAGWHPVHNFHSKNLFAQVESFLNQSMSTICDKLDFEEELKPANLWFKLENFTLSHQDKNIGKISTLISYELRYI